MKLEIDAIVSGFVMVHCIYQSVLREKDGKVTKERGCFRGLNHTCTYKYMREHCVSRDTGEKVSYGILIFLYQ